MALTHADFLLTDQQINAINHHIASRASAYAAADAEPACSARVEFEWVPGFGRFVTVCFDSEATGYEVEGFAMSPKTAAL